MSLNKIKVKVVLSAFITMCEFIFSPCTFAQDSNLRNCPASIRIQKFDCYDDDGSEARVASALGGSADIAIQKTLVAALSAGLPKADVKSMQLAVQEEASLQATEMAEFSEDEWGKRSRERDALVNLGKADFLINGKWGKAGNKYYLYTYVLNVSSARRIISDECDFNDLLLLPSVVEKVAQRLISQLKDCFYCVEVDPKKLSVRDKKLDLNAKVMNLQGKDIQAEKLTFMADDKSVGSMSPGEVSLQKGNAKSKYVVNRNEPNKVKVFISPKARAAEGITNGLWVPVDAGRLVLQFNGNEQDNISIPEAGWSQTFNYIVGGFIPLEIDPFTGSVSGTRFCSRKGGQISTGSFATQGASGTMQIQGNEEQIEAKVEGTVKDGLAQLRIITTSPTGITDQLHMEISGEEGTQMVDRAVTATESGQGATDPFEIRMEVGAKTHISKTWQRTPEVQVSYSYDVEIIAQDSD